MFGAIGGFFSGAVSGGINGAEDAARMIPALFEQAFRNFVNWALGRVQAALNHLADFVKACIDPMVAVIGNIAGAGVRAERAASLLLGKGDPGTHADAPAPGSYGDTGQGTDPRASDGDLITLNQAIGDPNAPLPPGYSRLTPAEIAALGLTGKLQNDGNGFIADVFKTPDGTYVVAFGGTTVGPGGAMPDVVEDGVGATTMSPQTQQVLDITDAIQRSGNGDDVLYTGHSLGGRLAAIAAIDTGNAAVTYDSAGVSQSTIDYVAAKNGVDPSTLVNQANDGQIRRYYAGDDALTFAQERWPVSAAGAPDALGTPIEVGPEKNDLTTIHDGTDVHRRAHARPHERPVAGAVRTERHHARPLTRDSSSREIAARERSGSSRESLSSSRENQNPESLASRPESLASRLESLASWTESLASASRSGLDHALQLGQELRGRVGRGLAPVQDVGQVAEHDGAGLAGARRRSDRGVAQLRLDVREELLGRQVSRGQLGRDRRLHVRVRRDAPLGELDEPGIRRVHQVVDQRERGLRGLRLGRDRPQHRRLVPGLPILRSSR